MKGKHTPTPAMKNSAKKGLKLISDGKVKESDVDDLALAGGKKIASGQKLSDEHVRAMANYHDGHAGECPSPDADDLTSAEDLLWGGQAGAMWSNSRTAAMDTTALADDSIDFDALMSESKPLSLEIYGKTPAGEKIYLDEDDSELLWAPILRSGTLATRPGANGQKVHDPLVFVAGHSDDPRQEIGLQDLIDAFDAGAVQHVTIPTTHENNVLDNTGFIEGMKLADSTLRQGETVLMAAHRFTEPDVRGRVERGSVANRSCGILYDYTNTESGQTFPSVIEHVCLTNRPFVPGMEPYGQLSELDFSERTVVPLLLSDAPLHLAGSGSKEGKSGEGGGSSSSVSDAAWDGSASRFTDPQYKRSCIINRGGKGSVKEECSLPVREPDGTLNRAAVHSAAGRISGLTRVTPEEKRAAARKLMSLYRGALKEDVPPRLLKIAAVSTKMSDEELRKELQLADVAWSSKGKSLNNVRSQLVSQLDAMRKGPNDEPSEVHFYVMDVAPDEALVACEYGYGGDEDTWVVPFTIDDGGDLSLSDFANWTPVTKEWVTDEDAQQDKQEIEGLLASKPPSPQLSADPLTQASNERLARMRASNPTPNTGGRSMSLTREQIGALNLSDQEKNVLLHDLDERETERRELAELRAGRRKGEVTTYITELSDKGLKGLPGLLAEVERLMMADDGKTAAVLNLADVGGSAETPLTVSEVVKRLMSALPLSETDPTKVDPTKLPTLLQSPIEGRPPAAPEKPEEGADKPLTGQQLADQWAQDMGGNLDLALAPAPGQQQAAPAPAAS